MPRASSMGEAADGVGTIVVQLLNAPDDDAPRRVVQAVEKSGLRSTQIHSMCHLSLLLHKTLIDLSPGGVYSRLSYEHGMWIWTERNDL